MTTEDKSLAIMQEIIKHTISSHYNFISFEKNWEDYSLTISINDSDTHIKAESIDGLIDALYDVLINQSGLSLV